MKTKKGKRSLNVLVWSGVCFFTFQIALSFCLDYLCPLIRFPALAQVLGAVPVCPNDKLIVCLGSSRFQVGIDPQEVGRTLQRINKNNVHRGILNAAVPSADPILCEHILKELIQSGTPIGQLILEVSPETLSRHTEWLYYHCRSFLRLDHLPNNITELCQQGHLIRLISLRIFPAYYYRHYLLSALKVLGLAETPWEQDRIRYFQSDAIQNNPQMNSIGPNDEIHLPERSVTAELRAEIDKMLGHQLPQRWLAHYQIEGKNSAALGRILSLCRRHAIAVVLVGVPVTTVHRKRYIPEIDKTYHRFITKLISDYSCTYVEARDWLPDSYFMDNHHLNRDGMIYFSRLIATKVLGQQHSHQFANQSFKLSGS